ncbi:hypothetical protein AB0J83_09905 [Actinoplanes sp. NPDC049596]|uniref:LGFP repeat-containing protein n=1 Tax=unclassified Actinoplanes TaxID=2626549 RepID=UPI0034466AAA
MPPVNYGVNAHSIESLTVHGGHHAGADVHARYIARDLVGVTVFRDIATRLCNLRPRTAAEVLAELAELDGRKAVAAVPYLNDEVANAARAAGVLVPAFAASAAIHECWKRHKLMLGEETGPLETAPAPEQRHGADSGFRTKYDHGVVYWSPATGAQPMWWGIAEYHERQGGTAGRLGFPLTAEITAVEPPNVVQRFQDKQDYGSEVVQKLGLLHGASVYWSPASGWHSTWGGVGEHYELLGGPENRLGFPVEDETPAGPSPQGTTGWQQRFQGGLILWTEETGGIAVFSAKVHEPESTPSIARYYTSSDGPAGPLGFPVGPRHDAAKSRKGTRGTLQRFEGRWSYGEDITGGWGGEVGGATVYRAWREGAEPHAVSGGIGEFHERAGGTGGWLGFPLTDELHTDLDQMACQLFEGGAVFWTSHTNTIAVSGSFDRPDQLDELVGLLGFPLRDEESFDRGRLQFFEFGIRTVVDDVARCWVAPEGEPEEDEEPEEEEGPEH